MMEAKRRCDVCGEINWKDPHRNWWGCSPPILAVRFKKKIGLEEHRHICFDCHNRFWSFVLANDLISPRPISYNWRVPKIALTMFLARIMKKKPAWANLKTSKHG